MNNLILLCIVCKDEREYIEKHDAYACKTCNSWLENQCEDGTCEFCVGRPEYPYSKEEQIEDGDENRLLNG